MIRPHAMALEKIICAALFSGCFKRVFSTDSLKACVSLNLRHRSRLLIFPYSVLRYLIPACLFCSRLFGVFSESLLQTRQVVSRRTLRTLHLNSISSLVTWHFMQVFI